MYEVKGWFPQVDLMLVADSRQQAKSETKHVFAVNLLLLHFENKNRRVDTIAKESYVDGRRRDL